MIVRIHSVVGDTCLVDLERTPSDPEGCTVLLDLRSARQLADREALRTVARMRLADYRRIAGA